MSVAFDLTLKATGYVSGKGQDAAGLLRPNHRDALRLRSVFANKRVGLNADALFFVQGAPAVLFKDAGKVEPSDQEVRRWREAAWNIAVAPLLWIITPTEVRLYDCYRAPRDMGSEAPLGRFTLEENCLTDLRDTAGRLATETGAFWSSPLGAKIDRRHRVDRELLGEISALEAKLTALPAARGFGDPDEPIEQQASRDFAQRLIGRCIFTWYLFDRGIVDAFRPKHWSGDLADRFATPEAAFDLFDWLRSTFNGDLFPMDDPGAERSRLGEEHLTPIRDFIQGQSLIDGQGRLFRFRFDAIPIDLVSSIYQQFARSSAAEDAQRQGLHYTPVELVHLTLDPVFEKLDPKARIIDPTCGSGAFLVEAFRRLVWRRCGGLPAKRAEVREILYTQLFGVDINRSALGIAAFSLYLAALEFDEEPLQSLADLKFHRLIGVTLFEADALDDLPAALTTRPFDAVVGNPPWTFDSDLKIATRKAGGARPRRSPDQAFLKVATRLAGVAGRVGMVMKATPFFSREGHAVAAREELLQALAPVGLVNLSALRREGLFPDATAPALLLFARCALMPDADQVLVGSVPWTPDFRRNGLFHLGPGEVRPVPLKRLLKTPALLKAAAFGTARDVWLIERLERDHRTLDEALDRLGVSGDVRGQGYQVKGTANLPPADYYRLKTLTPSDYFPFRLAEEDLEPFMHETLHRPRKIGIFRGPILLCPKGSFTAAAEAGRYSAAVYSGDLLYTENFYGISFADGDRHLAYVLSGILNSSLTTFQLVFGGGAFGLERSTVEPQDLLSLRIPDLQAADPEVIQQILVAEAANADRPGDIDGLRRLDEAVADLYELDRHELTIAQDSVARARILISESRAVRNATVRPPSPDQLADYACAAMTVVNGYLEAKGERRLTATIYDRSLLDADWSQGAPGLTAVRYHMERGQGGPGSAVWFGFEPGSELVTDLLDRHLPTDGQPPYLNERRQFRLYIDGDLIVVKPSEARYWTRTVGLNDADMILADHWRGTKHVRT